MGAAKEVGRSAFLVNCDHTNILMDYGVLLKREPIFPMHIMPKELDAVVITHAHLDHSGFVPSLYLSGTVDIPALGTLPTFELSELLIEDMIKLSGFYLPFEYIDLSVKERYESGWKEKVTTRIRRSDGVIALISKNTPRSEGELWEISTAVAEGKPLLGIWLGDYRTKPSEMGSAPCQTWAWDNVNDFIDSL